MKKTLKKMLPILLAVMVMVLAIPVAFAADEMLTFGPSVTGVLNTETGELVISGTGPMDDFTSSTSPTALYANDITSIIIESGVTSIGAYTFNNCTGLTSITISDSVANIGDYAFSGCVNLSNIVNLYENTQTIASYHAFENCGQNVSDRVVKAFSTNTSFITMMSSTAYIVRYILPDGIETTTINLGTNVNGVLNISTGVLTISGSGSMKDYMMNSPLRYYDITSVIVEEGITNIGLNLFSNCEYLTSVMLPEGVTNIGNGAFSSCRSLTSINLPSSVTYIGNNAFFACPLITSITIPNGVTTISGNTFYHCTGLSSIVIPKSVSEIGGSAFKGCSSLDTIINYYDGVQTIGSGAFNGIGASVSTQKTVYCSPANTTFSSLLTSLNYSILDIKDVTVTTTGEGTAEATVPMTGTIEATTISVSHPLSVEYAIDPNLGYDGGAFVAPDIAITNNSIVPVKVTVKSLSSAVGGSVQFTDVAPGARDWAHLGVAESKSCIALGVKIANSAGWKAGHKADTRYAVETGDTLFGTLSTGATGHMSMVANYGLSINQNCTAAHNLVFMFDLA